MMFKTSLCHKLADKKVCNLGWELRTGERLVLSIAEKPLVMGILNVTPDSFSDGGRHDDIDRAVARAHEMVREGADIIDIGGESTRPGHIPVDRETELARTIPVIRALRAAGISVPLSIDTWKASVAEAALSAGADIVNDIWGLKGDPDMARVVAEHRVPVIVMHNRSEARYDRFLPEVIDDLKASLELLDRAGGRQEQVIIDPGIGFGKTYEMNIEMLAHLDLLHTFGRPLLLGVSRKSVIGKTLGTDIAARLEGSLALALWGNQLGVHMFRVHDVLSTVRALKMWETVRTSRQKNPIHQNDAFDRSGLDKDRSYTDASGSDAR